MLDPLSLILLILLGMLFGLDTVSFPQAMISRPICSATVTGIMLGSPVSGITAGVVLEIMALDTLPFGASRYPDWGVAGVVAGAVASLLPEPLTWSVVLLTIGSGLAAAALSSWSMVLLRYINVKVLKRYSSQLAEGQLTAIKKVHSLGIGLDALRAALVTAISILILLTLVQYLHSFWHASPQLTAQFGVTVLAGVGFAAAWKLFRAVNKGILFFGAGLLAGLGVIYLS